MSDIRTVVAGVMRRLRPSPADKRRADQALLFDKFRDFTMIPFPRFADNLALCERVSSLPGDIVECGTWRGGMSAAMNEYLAEGTEDHRVAVLLDSFQGLPPAQPIDGTAALAWQAATDSPDYYDNCSASSGEARTAMELAGATNYRIIAGWFDVTARTYASETPVIALLRLDCDWYESTMTCLATLFPSLTPGGIVILDDYGTWEGCTRAVHDFMASESRPEPIQHTPAGVAFFEKRES